MNGPLRQQLEALAARSTGVVCADVASYAKNPRPIGQLLARMVREGDLHASRNAHADQTPGRRACRTRYFGSVTARDEYERAHQLAPKDVPRPLPAPKVTRKPASQPRRKAAAESTWWPASSNKPVGSLTTYARPPAHAPRSERRSPTDLPFVHRPGALDHAELPSRMGNVLVYRDGRRETLEG